MIPAALITIYKQSLRLEISKFSRTHFNQFCCKSVSEVKILFD